jgi:hypothetical protein
LIDLEEWQQGYQNPSAPASGCARLVKRVSGGFEVGRLHFRTIYAF